MKSPDVDPGALVLAAATISVTLLTGSGDWAAVDIGIGLALSLVVLAFHTKVGPDATGWHSLRRLAFGAVLGLTVCIGLAYPLQELLTLFGYSGQQKHGSSEAGGASSGYLMGLWLVLALLIASFEPRLDRLLEKEWSVPRRRGPRGNDRARLQEDRTATAKTRRSHISGAGTRRSGGGESATSTVPPRARGRLGHT